MGKDHVRGVDGGGLLIIYLVTKRNSTVIGECPMRLEQTNARLKSV